MGSAGTCQHEMATSETKTTATLEVSSRAIAVKEIQPGKVRLSTWGLRMVQNNADPLIVAYRG